MKVSFNQVPVGARFQFRIEELNIVTHYIKVDALCALAVGTNRPDLHPVDGRQVVVLFADLPQYTLTPIREFT